MTPEQLAAIEAREKAATEGPWSALPLQSVVEVVHDGHGKPIATVGSAYWQRYTHANFADATFIAHARTDIPALLAAYRAKEAECARLREAMKDARDMVADWAAYASEYYQKKWRLDEDLAKIDAALEAKS